MAEKKFFLKHLKYLWSLRLSRVCLERKKLLIGDILFRFEAGAHVTNFLYFLLF